MKSKRLHEVETLYRAALERDPAERQAYLDEACAGDEDLRGEIESLLAYDERAAGFLEIPAMDVEARSMAAEPRFLFDWQTVFALPHPGAAWSRWHGCGVQG